jgi:two-component system, OmpR family, sensor histidine kinase KdpD
VVWVADRGPGLPIGEEERVFEKFHRGPAAPGAGVGLGLAICRGIVTAHGGRIWAENQPGGGSIFRLTLPIIGEPPQIVGEEAISENRELEVGGAWTPPPRSSL